MTGITWLHLSDWHQKGDTFNRTIVRDRLIEDIRNRKKISGDLEKIDFIVFSGDIAFSGKAEEYEKARECLFTPLLAATGLRPERLFIIPGNHDLDRTALELLPDEILHPFNFDRSTPEEESGKVEKSRGISLRTSFRPSTPEEESGKVEKWLRDERRRNRLLEPFAAFKQFVSVYTGQTHSDYGSLRRFKINGKRVALLGINSALMCGRNKNPTGEIDDKGFLTIGEPQIYDALNQMEYYDLRIAVLHHPFNWLSEFEQNRIEGDIHSLKNVCHFILYGHEHSPKFIQEVSLNGNCVNIPAGAAYDRRFPDNSLYNNAYNFVHVDLGTGKGTIYFRRWLPDKSIWSADLDNAPYSPYGQREFQVPAKNVLPLPLISGDCRHKIDNHFDKLVPLINSGEVVPFLGANINLCDRSKDDQENFNPWEWEPEGDYPPTTIELATYLNGRDYLQEVSCPLLNRKVCTAECPINTALIHKIDISHLSQYDHIRKRSLLINALKVYSQPYCPNGLHKLLAGLPSRYRGKHFRHPSEGSNATQYQLIVTANIDSTLERAFQEAKQPFDLVLFIGSREIAFIHQRFELDSKTSDLKKVQEDKIVPEQANNYPKLSLNDRPVILKLYGSAENFVITEDQFIDYLVCSEISTLIPSSLLNKLRNSHIWFLGYSLSHWNQRVILNRLWPDRVNRGQQYSWFVIQPKRELLDLDETHWKHSDQHPTYLSDHDLFLENYVTELEIRLQNESVKRGISYV
jgi:predicted phosphodiesterase